MVIRTPMRVVNPKRRTVTRRKARARRPSGNPAHMLTLGFINPKKGKTVAKPKRRRKYRARPASRATNRRRANPRHRRMNVRRHRRRTAVSNHRRRRSNPRRSMMMVPKRRRNRRRNPFGSSHSAKDLVESAVGVLVGVTGTRTLCDPPALRHQFEQYLRDHRPVRHRCRIVVARFEGQR